MRAGTDGTLAPAGDATLRWSLNPKLLAHLLPRVRDRWPGWTDAADAVFFVQSAPLVNVCTGPRHGHGRLDVGLLTGSPTPCPAAAGLRVRRRSVPARGHVGRSAEAPVGSRSGGKKYSRGRLPYWSTPSAAGISDQVMPPVRRVVGSVFFFFAEAIPTTGNPFEFWWIVDFPLLTPDEEGRRFVATHHPFTAPHPDDVAKLAHEPAKVRRPGQA